MATILHSMTALRRGVLHSAVVALSLCAYTVSMAAPISGDLIMSRSVYTGTASTVTVGQVLPGGGGKAAVANGSYPGVWANETPDPSFGVTSPIFLDRYTIASAGTTLGPVSTFAVPTTQLVTSFPSKSELALNLSTDQQFITFMGYISPANALDISNSNTPNHVDATNPVNLQNQRGVAQIDATGASGTVQVTAANVYSGNNGRAVILDNKNNQYVMVGNAGNGSGTEPTNIVNNTGVQIITPGSANPESTVVGVQQGSPGSANGFQFGFSIVQPPYNTAPYNYTADKSGKDDNFRGLTIANNTLYVTKGSGSNGINTVYQVGAAGTLPTANTASSTAFSILPGLPTVLAKNIPSTAPFGKFPFGIWFANATTLYVADEGTGKAADAATNANAGLQKWIYQSDNQWHNVYTLQNGLNLGVQYSVSGYPTNLNPAPGGLRNLTGRDNGDGTVTLFAVTSTVSTNTDTGADPNQVVAITDNLSYTTAAAAAGEAFSVLASANYGEVLRGVAYLPLTSQVSSVISGTTFNRKTQTFMGTIQLTNTSNRAIAGPIQVELQNLTSGVTLANAFGTDSSNGNPYLTTAPGGLAPGDTVTVPVQFSDPAHVGINYTVQILSGNF